MNSVLRASMLVSMTLLVFACADSSDTSNAVGDEPELRSAEVSLVVPLIDEKKKLLSRFNAQAREKGLNELPDTVEVRNEADADKFDELRDYFNDKTMPAVSAPDQAMPAWSPDSFTNWSRSRTPGLCYRGNPTKVVELIERALAGRVFSEQLIIDGWRYKTEKHFADGAAEFEDGFPDVWQEWQGTGTAVLLVASINDDGDDLGPSIIPRCR
jgi:hypothetical protein